MPTRLTSEDIDRLVLDAGWYPGRDVTGQAQEMARFVVSDLAAHDCRVAEFPAAEEFLRSYGLLEVRFPYDEERVECFHTSAKYCGDWAEGISELSGVLGRSLFPVGADELEGGLVLMDPLGWMFYLHHSGAYFVGEGIREVIAGLHTGRVQRVGEYDA